MTFGSLFAGIGGLDLGLERAGMTCAWQVENDPYAIKILAKHWPNVRRHDDVRTFPQAGEWGCDLVSGGFPCQPVSVAGKGLAQSDDRWLWPEVVRILRVVRPRFVLLENTPGLLVRGMGIVLGDLTRIGFDAEWSIVSACSLGFPHMRRRLFIVAYPAGSVGQEGLRFREYQPSQPLPSRSDRKAEILGLESAAIARRGADGVPARVRDHLRVLGNAVVPQVAQWIGERIMESFHASQH